jgi:CRP-like cAMP-binding protein
MTNHDLPRQNHLLGVLPAEHYRHLFPHLELVSLSNKEVLYETGEKLRYAYFPTDCIVSKQYITENGSTAEVAVIGNEGIIGAALFMGGNTMLNRAIVVRPGNAYRLRAERLKQEFQRTGGRRNGVLHQLLLRHTQALITQLSQTAACNRHHSIEQQFCRWLLQSLDRQAGTELSMTHESIASLLGVRREGVTESARKLNRAGLIDYSRGHISVLNRYGLEARVCECYRVIKTEYDRLFPCVIAPFSSHCALERSISMQFAKQTKELGFYEKKLGDKTGGIAIH